MITARPPCSCTTLVLERKEQPLEEVGDETKGKVSCPSLTSSLWENEGPQRTCIEGHQYTAESRQDIS